MHKIGLAVIALLAMALPALAQDRSMVVTDQDHQAWSAIPPAMDQCVAGLILRSDPAPCRMVSAYLAEYSARVQRAPPSPPAATPTPAPTGE